MRRGTLLTQVLLVNLLLIAAAVLAASLATHPESTLRDSDTTGIVLGFALAATVAVNVFLLSRRFEPLERLVEEMESADLSRPSAARAAPDVRGSEEVRRLQRTFREMLARLEAERRAAAEAALAAQERERARIALDLHDEVNQALTGLLLRIGTLRRKVDDPRLVAELDAIGKVASAAMEELLGIARRLRPSTLDDLGLEAALEALAEEVGDESGTAVAFEAEGDFEGLGADVQLVAYRVAQEALSNVVQHAEARHARVRLLRAGAGLELRIADDGRGFATGNHVEALGIAGMRERALLSGGTLTVESEPGAGTRVTLRA